MLGDLKVKLKFLGLLSTLPLVNVLDPNFNSGEKISTILL